MDKQIYDLAPSDLINSPLWFFPMDETVEDEATARPVVRGQGIPDGLQMIVKCHFEDATGRSYLGYVYPGEAQDVETARPVLWAADLCVTFWNGMIEPTEAYVAKVAAAIPSAAWPIRYASEAGLGVPVMSGVLEGLYFVDGSVVRLQKCA